MTYSQPACFFFFFNDAATPEISPLSLHDPLPISGHPPTRPASIAPAVRPAGSTAKRLPSPPTRSEEHTSELQSRLHLVCRLLLEKKKRHMIRLPQASAGASVNISHRHFYARVMAS